MRFFHRIVSLILVFVLLSGICQPGADRTTASASMPDMPPYNEDQFIDILRELDIPIESESGRPANWDTFVKYGLIVYGSPWGDRKGSEYRYLGYTYYDKEFTNHAFPDDITPTRPPETWNFVERPDALESWEPLRDKQGDHAFYSRLIGHNATTLTVASHLSKTKAIVQAPPTVKSYGSIKTYHIGLNGKLYYATFLVPPLPGSVDFQLDAQYPTALTIPADSDSVTAVITLTVTATPRGCASIKNTYAAQVIDPFNQGFTGNRSIINPGASTDNKVTVTYAHTFKRSDYEPGTHTVPLLFAGYASTQYNDIFSEDRLGQILLTVEPEQQPPPPPPPPPSGSVTADLVIHLTPPALESGTEQDVAVKLDASGLVSTSSAGYFGYRWWAKHNDTWLTPEEGINPGTSSPYYNLTAYSASPGDSIWARVRVWDPVLNKTDEAEAERVIGETSAEEPPPGSGGEDPPPGGGDDDPPPPPEPEPPVAVIRAPSEVVQGDGVIIRSASYDPDGYIVSHSWSVSPSTGMVGELSGERSEVWFDEPGTYTIRLTVRDSDGERDTTQKTIEVLPAVPEAYFDFTGRLKQNRKIVFDASNSVTSDRYPMIWDETEWEFLPPEGVSADSIKIAASSDKKIRTVLFKEPGEYTVRVRVKNEAGHYSDWYERKLEIMPDLPPVADFYVYSTAIRDPKEDGPGSAAITLYDLSYSPDGDHIEQRIWRYKYDANNNGSFEDEEWVILDDGNSIEPVLHTDHVGRYLFELAVKERFGEETIPEFIGPTDLRQADTAGKPLSDKCCEVINLPPVAGFDILKNRKADIVFTVGRADSGKVQDINGKINAVLMPRLAAENINAEIEAVKTAVVSTETQDPQDIFSSWVSFYVGSSSTPPQNAWSYDSELNAVVCNIGSRPALGWYNPSAFDTKDLTISYTLGIRNDATQFVHGEMGFMFRMQDENNYYVYIIDNHSACGNVRYDQRSVLAKVTNGRFQVVKVGGSFPYFHRGQIWNIRIEAKGNTIKVYRDGSLDIEWTDPDPAYYDHGSYGFYAWDQRSAYFKDIQITSESIKTLDEALKSTTWRSNATRFLVNISDITLPELDSETKLGEILSHTLTGNIHFVGLGTDANKSQYETFIAQNNDSGRFFYNTDMNDALSRLADYILEILNMQPDYTALYALVGEEVSYETTYSDGENDPKYQDRWYYYHDPTYFENSLGLAPFSGQYLSEPVTKFKHTGMYEIHYQARDNPKDDSRFDSYRLWSSPSLNRMYLYVHRKPIAAYAAELEPVNSNTTVVYQKSNIDFSGEGGRWAEWCPQFSAPEGAVIKTIEFRTPRADDDYWRGTLSVKGYKDGAWHIIKNYSQYAYTSEPISDTINVDGDGYTKVQFYFEMYDKAKSAGGSPDGSYIKITYIIDSVTSYNVNLVNHSYDPDHQTAPDRGIEEEEWLWREVTETSWNTGRLTSAEPNKSYLVWLRVRDREGVWSDPYVSMLSTVQENLPPVAQFAVDPSVQVVHKTIEITDMSYDPNGDPIAEQRWMVKKPDGEWLDYGSTPPTDIPSLGEGEYTIELTVRDDPSVGSPLWSEAYTQQVMVIPENSKPAAGFSVNPDPVIADEFYEIIDLSSDPDGDPIVAYEWRVRKPDGTWAAVTEWLDTFEEMGFDDGEYLIRLRVMDDPTGRHPALTPMWSDPFDLTVTVEGRLIVIGRSDKSITRRATAMLLSAETEGRAYRVDVHVWYKENDFVSSSTNLVTTLVPDEPLTDPPQDRMTWHSRRVKGDRDLVLVVPFNIPDGVYPVTFKAYKRRSDGSIKVEEDTIMIRVKDSIHDYLYFELIGPLPEFK
ncbi:hypothetical protein H0A61_02973 [Koleobacter methoxysyntrophicus]|uniref:PKD domain-containing protein n=1 Tax=Koleobacter methoxysyntrophicus TaxID=2751313 RepID=A0A8A0RQM1_9FIRM|nr:hypothetical protein H0A61_02973 [Koleobacter methoxysyntrophicus]